MSCFDTVPCHRSRLPDTTHLNSPPLSASLTVCVCVGLCVWSMLMCLFAIREGWADTSNGEKCSAPTQRYPRSFQLLSFDSDVQGWVMVWGKPKYLEMNGREKKKSSWCVSNRKHIWVRSSTRFNSLPGTKCRCASVCVWQTSLRKPLYNLVIRHG